MIPATTKEIDDYFKTEISSHINEEHDGDSCTGCQQTNQAKTSKELHKYASYQADEWIENSNKTPNLESFISSVIANSFIHGVIAGIAISEKRELERIVSGQHS